MDIILKNDRLINYIIFTLSHTHNLPSKQKAFYMIKKISRCHKKFFGEALN